MSAIPAESSASPEVLGRFPQERGYFIRRMRLHQAWWRKFRLGEDSFGEHRAGYSYANYLTPEAAQKGLNFLTPEIAAVVLDTHSQKVEKRRNETNLLSSQPMAFNLFGPLQARPKLAQSLLDPILPGGVSCAAVKIEYTPDKKTHLNDGTSLDVFIDYRDRSGFRRLVGIETKLTEPFSRASLKKRPDREEYRRLTREVGLWRTEKAYADMLPGHDCWQLWRNHLLIEKIRLNEDEKAGSAKIASSLLWVIHHPLDECCRGAMETYAQCLKTPEEIFRADTLRDVTRVWIGLAGDADRQWLHDFQDRYLELQLSDRFASHLSKRKASAPNHTIVRSLCGEAP